MTLVHRRHTIGITALAALALALPLAVRAQAGVEPNAQIQANSGEDYAATELGNPWDMDSSNDIAFEYTRDNGQIANLRFEDGKLKGTTGGDARVTLLMPSNPNVNPVLPEGGFRPINTTRYRYLTIRMNVDKTSQANVYWQSASNAAFNGWVETSGQNFKQFNPGDNIITFDLGASSKWTGDVQGLYFDPHAASGVNFQIDYVRLSTQLPGEPDNTPPQFAITAPSYISGPDYATKELGNPWDMNDGSDLSLIGNITNISYNNGIMRGVNTSGDPHFHLRINGSINPAKYKYLTYRFSVDGKIDTVLGSVARTIWWSDIPQNSTTTRDTVIYEGFRTVSFDLTKIRTESIGGNRLWLQSTPTVFRFDPHEFAAPREFNVDYLLLTGDSTANASYDIRYTLSDADGGNPTVQWFFDTDKDASGGTTPITCSTSPNAQVAATNSVYLPLTSGGSNPPVQPEGAACRWNTANVPNGTYYVYGIANDGTDSVGRYSVTPVVVSH